MRKIVIYPGRFHPFHKGHAGTYESLVKQFGANNVFVASSAKQAPLTSPFSFEEKTVMMQALGIPPQQIVQVKNTYNATEITSRFDQNNTVVIYALGFKDVDRMSFTKKDGSKSYLQPFEGQRKLRPMKDEGYVIIAPTVTFTILGKSYQDASKIRNDYIAANDKTRMKMIADLYGSPNDQIKQIFDKALQLSESYNRLEESMLSLPLLESKSDLAEEFIRITRNILQLENEAKENEYNGIR